MNLPSSRVGSFVLMIQPEFWIRKIIHEKTPFADGPGHSGPFLFALFVRKKMKTVSLLLPFLGCSLLASLFQDNLSAQTIKGELFYTRFRADRDPFRVKKVSYQYDGKTFLLGKSVGIAKNIGADGLLFSPRKTLLIAGQRNGKVCEVDPAKAPGKNVVGCSPKAASGLYHLTMDPGQKKIWSSGLPGGLLVEIPIQPKLGKPIAHRLNGGSITQIIFANGITFYTSSRSSGRGGTLGILDMKTWSVSPKIKNVSGLHGIAFDSYTGTLIAFGDQYILQIEASKTPKILAKLDVTTLPKAPRLTGSIDQGSVDGNGLIFAPTNGNSGPGQVIFLDIRKSKRVDRPDFSSFKTLEWYLDDIAPLSGAGCSSKAIWGTFGQGWKGTLGIPAVSLSAPPKLGTTISIQSSNSLGRLTHGCLIIGASSATKKTPFGGTLFVDMGKPYVPIAFTIPSKLGKYSLLVPNKIELCGFFLYGQIIQNDPGASHGISFTKGFNMRLGL
jgi:hypothetical protein